MTRYWGLGGLLAAALVAHLWMLPSFGDAPPSGETQTLATAAPAAGALMTADCPMGMSACVTTADDKPPLLPVLALSTLAALLWKLRRRGSPDGRTRSSHHRPSPPLTPVDERVLLLE